MNCRTIVQLIAILGVMGLVVQAPAQQRGLSLAGHRQDPDTWGTYHALIIGINAYQQWPKLQTAVKDATIIRDVLVKRYGFGSQNVILRTDKQASRKQIIRDLRYLATAMTSKDNMLIYFAGHGQLDDLTGDGFWIPAEGAMKDSSTWVSNAYIKAVLSSEKVEAKNVVVIADSCYSGAMLRGGPSLISLDDGRYRQKLVKKAALRSRQVISSGGIEPVADGGAEGHSLFAFYFINALRKNEREVIDLENLFHTKVWEPVSEIGNQSPNVGRLRTPMDQDGQFVLYNVAWVQQQAERRAATELRQEEKARQARVTAAELELQRKRFEVERQKLALEKEQLAKQKALEVERLKFEKQKQEFEYAKLQARLQEMEAKRKEREQQGQMGVASVKQPPVKQRVANNQQREALQQEMQASVHPQALNSRQAALESYVLAIFPFNMFATETNVEYIGPNTHAALKAIDEVAHDEARVSLKYSYREIEGSNSEVMLLASALKGETLDVWIKKSFFSMKEPDWDKIHRLASKVNADLVIMLDRDVSSVKCTYYLFDTKNSKLYSDTSEVIHYGLGPYVKKAVKGLLKDFYRRKR